MTSWVWICFITYTDCKVTSTTKRLSALCLAGGGSTVDTTVKASDAYLNLPSCFSLSIHASISSLSPPPWSWNTQCGGEAGVSPTLIYYLPSGFVQTPSPSSPPPSFRPPRGRAHRTGPTWRPRLGPADWWQWPTAPPGWHSAEGPHCGSGPLWPSPGCRPWSGACR